jgi:cytochrome c-type biogenesis protein CcmH
MNATLFWLLAGGLLAGAVALVVIPLCRGRIHAGAGQSEHNIAAYRRQLAELRQERDEGAIDETAYLEARDELERRLLEDTGPAGEAAPAFGHTTGAAPHRSMPWAAAVLALALPALVLGVYQRVGTSPAHIQALQDDPQALAELGLRNAVEGLEQHLERDPLDDAGWHMLGRGYARMGALDEAASALRRAAQLRGGDDPELLTDLAQVLALTRPDQSLQGEPRRLLERALRVDPDHPEALWLGGMAAAEAGEMGLTADRWERLLALEGDSAQAEQLRRAIAAMRERHDEARSGGDSNTVQAPPGDGAGRP